MIKATLPSYFQSRSRTACGQRFGSKPWDFDDVRDHYLQRLFGVDPIALRSSDHERYLALSRAVSAEVMRTTFGEWRRGASACRGALVWFARDLWAGAGWGVVDDQGVPKAAFHGIRQACAPLAICISDEGTNGLEIHVVNEPDRELALGVEVTLYRDDGLAMHRCRLARVVAARGTLSANLAEWLDGFVDVSRAYRFGPAEHTLVVASLLDANDLPVAQAFHFPEGLPSRRERDIGLTAQAQRDADGSALVTIRTARFAQSLHFDVPGFIAQDEFFHLAPGSQRVVKLVVSEPGTQPALRGSVHALNAWTSATLKLQP